MSMWYIATLSLDGKRGLLLTWGGEWKPFDTTRYESFTNRSDAVTRALKVFAGWGKDDQTNWSVIVIGLRDYEMLRKKFLKEETVSKPLLLL